VIVGHSSGCAIANAVTERVAKLAGGETQNTRLVVLDGIARADDGSPYERLGSRRPSRQTLGTLPYSPDERCGFFPGFAEIAVRPGMIERNA